ncbi:hypothetical protein ESA_02490 [Cronobacter sakazakii ATCC BAA-894]|uniref:Uncharacterized protein n=1 Tax=Cronobacter sakazakii (strain ATCC BAA-894) TaxID=290339 RepID=A7MF24_CROS8|nr:hypothetical protein ESA_02490 [Cronobacter sakazakii ATCC BAA-894]
MIYVKLYQKTSACLCGIMMKRCLFFVIELIRVKEEKIKSANYVPAHLKSRNELISLKELMSGQAAAGQQPLW